jgi:hypothetical protein
MWENLIIYACTALEKRALAHAPLQSVWKWREKSSRSQLTGSHCCDLPAWKLTFRFFCLLAVKSGRCSFERGLIRICHPWARTMRCNPSTHPLCCSATSRPLRMGWRDAHVVRINDVYCHFFVLIFDGAFDSETFKRIKNRVKILLDKLTLPPTCCISCFDDQSWFQKRLKN